LIKFIASGVAGAAAVAGSGYQYVTSQNVRIESLTRTNSEFQQKLDADSEAMKSKNAAIDNALAILKDARGYSPSVLSDNRK
jgi:hypothetical protein